MLTEKILKYNHLENIYRPVRNLCSTCRVLEVSKVSDPLPFNGGRMFVTPTRTASILNTLIFVTLSSETSQIISLFFLSFQPYSTFRDHTQNAIMIYLWHQQMVLLSHTNLHICVVVKFDIFIELTTLYCCVLANLTSSIPDINE